MKQSVLVHFHPPVVIAAGFHHFHAGGHWTPSEVVEQQECDDNEHRDDQQEEDQEAVPEGVVWHGENERENDGLHMDGETMTLFLVRLLHL